VKSTTGDSSPGTDPTFESAFRSADECFKQGALGQALTYIEEALKAKPRDLRALNKKGAILAGMDRTDEALACFERILDTDPAYLDAVLSKGPVLTHLGRHEEAASCYETALHRGPKDHRILSNLGNAYLRLGRRTKALECYREAFEISHDTRLLSSIRPLEAELRASGEGMAAEQQDPADG
jgi:tetratricopeptide (TPR) repeat protein